MSYYQNRGAKFLQGDSKSGEDNRHYPNLIPPFGFDPRIYPEILNAAVNNTNNSTNEPAKVGKGSSQPQRPNHLGDLKTVEETRHQHQINHPTLPFGFDPRIYPALSSVPPINSNNSFPTAASKVDKSPSQPQRPNHLGSNFIPQTHFLSANINHGGNIVSDKDGLLSTNSPVDHRSLYSNSSHQTSSPGSVSSDKLKDKREFSCPECSKSFPSASALAKHALIHSDERKFVCNICHRGFKRQDHLNGHMMTHSDKKPYVCHVQDCGKNYSDMRSLKRHYENQHHNSPIGGATPSSYMPKLYPEYSEAMLASMPHHQHKPERNNLQIPTSEPQRPSSAPLVVPVPKRITRNRRSSSGEENNIQLDAAMIHTIESRKFKEEESSIHGVEPRSQHMQRAYSPKSHGLLTTSSASSANNYDTRKLELNRLYEQQKLSQRYLSEFEKYKRDLASSHPNYHYRDMVENDRSSIGLKEKMEAKRAFSPSSSTASYPPSVVPPVMNSHYLWGPRPNPSSSGNANMPYLPNMRKPSNFPSHPMYPHMGTVNESRDSKDPSKSYNYFQQQAFNTYFQMLANGPRGSLTPEQLSLYHNQYLRASQNISTPTDPAAIAIATAKEHAERPHIYPLRDSYYGIHPAMTQWQSAIMQEELSRTGEKETKPYFPSSAVPSSVTNTNSSNDMTYIRPSPVREMIPTKYATPERNIVDEPFKPSENNAKDRFQFNSSPHRSYGDRTSSNRQPVPEQASQYDNQRTERPTLLEPTRTLEPPRSLDIPRTSPMRFEQLALSTSHRTEKILESPHVQVKIETPDDGVSIHSPGRKRPRPGPLVIPPAMNSKSSPNSVSPSKNLQSVAKNIYTPPAMLSPKSVFFNPPAPTPRTNNPGTPARFLLSSIRRSTSIDQREANISNSVSSDEQLQITTEVPEPKINVGSEFQATLPTIMDRSEAQKDIHRASLMWAPVKEDNAKFAEINAYLDMACSLALYGGSNNKEYALHILQRTRGNVKEAVRLLLSRRHILRADDPNADYHYSGSVRWTAKERLAFRQAYRTKGKLFSAIQKEIGTKSVQLCVEFYYLWKAMHPESFRARTRLVEVESEQDDEEVPPTPTAAVAPLSTLREPVFECDYPECRARFVSRQALNGHIRVHGGSLSKPTEARRPKPKQIVITTPTIEINHIQETPPPKKKKTVEPSFVITPDGPQAQFQCKVCGRVFSKVKSRSAHMKTHVKRDENKKPIVKTAKQQKQQKQQAKHHTIPPPPHLPQGPPNLPPPPHLPHQQTQPPQQSSINPMTLYAHA